MKLSLLVIFPFVLLTASCKRSSEDMLTRKWQEVSIDNPTMQGAIDEQQHFIDTMGAHTSPDENEHLYGIRDLDSLKTELINQVNAYHVEQQRIIDNTWFLFRKDGIVLLNSDEGVDSASWYLDEDKNLILDEMKLKGTGSTISMQILELTDTSLKLSFTQDNATSTVRFKPVKN